MKIAVVRGAFLNPFECQLYAPLARNHEITLVGANWQFYPHALSFPGVKVRQASVWGAHLSRLHPRAPIAANRLLSWSTGRSFGFYDLDRCIGPTDVLHSAETFFTMTHQCVAIKRARGSALVITVSENLPHMGERHPWRRRQKKKAIEAADAFIAITETTRRMLIAEGISSDKITVIPWSLDLKRFRPAPKDTALLSQFNLTPDDFVVLFVGRLIPEKGIRDILESIPRVAVRVKNKRVRFLFVGDGPLAAEVRDAERRTPERIRLGPFVPYDQLPALHNLADLFLLPSKAGHKIAEQFGFVLIESMACRKPVITTSVGSIPDVVGDAAFRIEPSRPLDLAIAINHFLESEELRESFSTKAFARVQEHFDAGKNAKRVESVYTQALKGIR